MATDDNILFIQIKQGNKLAFDNLFRKYYAQICRFALSMLRSPDLSEEVVQEVFVKLWNNRDKISVDTSIVAYLYTAVKNQSLNLIKKNNIRQKYESEYAEVRGESEERIEQANEDELKNKVGSAVMKLPEKCREIFQLCKNDGLTYDEIAEYLKISKKTVENQMTIAFRKLREMLQPVMDDLYG